MYEIPDGATTNAQEVIAAFNDKAHEAAVANGWSPAYAAEVILRFLRDTDPETARVVAVSWLLMDPPRYAASETVLGDEDTRIRLSHPIRVF